MRETEGRIILDFDNLLTDGEAEKQAYQDVYLPHFARAFELPLGYVSEEFPITEDAVRSHPEEHLLSHAGIPIGPGTSDHMLLTFSTAKQILCQWRHTPPQEPLPHADAERFFRIYTESYPKTGVIYRHGAKELVTDLQKTGRLSIVSGSNTSDIRTKLSVLLRGTGIDACEIDLHGNARKTYVDTVRVHASDIPWHIHNFPYLVYFNRPVFSAILAAFPQHIAVAASDQYTGDLSQYEHMGTYTVMLETRFMVPWERPLYPDHPNGMLATSLYDVREAMEVYV